MDSTLISIVFDYVYTFNLFLLTAGGHQRLIITTGRLIYTYTEIYKIQINHRLNGSDTLQKTRYVNNAEIRFRRNIDFIRVNCTHENRRRKRRVIFSIRNPSVTVSVAAAATAWARTAVFLRSSMSICQRPFFFSFFFFCIYYFSRFINRYDYQAILLCTAVESLPFDEKTKKPITLRRRTVESTHSLGVTEPKPTAIEKTATRPGGKSVSVRGSGRQHYISDVLTSNYTRYRAVRQA